MKNKSQDILSSNFKLLQIAIENFTVPGSDLKIIVRIDSKQFGMRDVFFDKVKGLNVNPDAYVWNEKPSIAVEDLSKAQMEGIAYKVAIAEDAMTFYCKEIDVSEPWA